MSLALWILREDLQGHLCDAQNYENSPIPGIVENYILEVLIDKINEQGHDVCDEFKEMKSRLRYRWGSASDVDRLDWAIDLADGYFFHRIFLSSLRSPDLRISINRACEFYGEAFNISKKLSDPPEDPEVFEKLADRIPRYIRPLFNFRGRVLKDSYDGSSDSPEIFL